MRKNYFQNLIALLLFVSLMFCLLSFSSGVVRQKKVIVIQEEEIYLPEIKEILPPGQGVNLWK